MNNVVSIKPNSNVKQGLQNIVDAYEGEENATVLMGGKIYHLGCVSDGQAAADALWNISTAQYKLMAATHGD
jgi:hypothetical protein